MSGASWKLQDAKARFSEVVRRARSEGPQHVTVHGRDSVVIMSAEDFAQCGNKPEVRTGGNLVVALRGFQGLNIGRESARSPVRPDVTFD